MTEIDRRSFLAAAGATAGMAAVGLGAMSVLPAHVLGASQSGARQSGTSQSGARDLFAAARKDRQGRYSAVIFDPDSGRELASVALPARGHDIVVRPQAEPAAKRGSPVYCRDCVVFARRPGNFAVVFNDNPQRPALWFSTRPDRRFYGHGAFSPDGRLLFTTENDFEAGRGVIGVRDAAQGYKQIGELQSGGVGPHDLVMLSDGKTLVVANGGIRTHPDMPRLQLNLSTMRPNLAYINTRNGDLLERHELPAHLHQLSMRHLNVGVGDRVIFGCQFKGPRWKTQAIIGRHRRGQQVEQLLLPAAVLHDMRNYVASVEVDRSGAFAIITAPRGGLAVVIEVASGKFVARQDMDNVFGAAARRNRPGVLLSSGSGALESWSWPGMAQAGLEAYDKRLAYAWDNHLVSGM